MVLNLHFPMLVASVACLTWCPCRVRCCNRHWWCPICKSSNAKKCIEFPVGCSLVWWRMVGHYFELMILNLHFPMLVASVACLTRCPCSVRRCNQHWWYPICKSAHAKECIEFPVGCSLWWWMMLSQVRYLHPKASFKNHLHFIITVSSLCWAKRPSRSSVLQWEFKFPWNLVALHLFEKSNKIVLIVSIEGRCIPGFVTGFGVEVSGLHQKC